MKNWPANSIQLVWFSPQSRDVKATDLYEQIFGHPADSAQENRNIAPQTPFFSSASGTIDGNAYEVTVLPGRVDAYIRPNIDIASDAKVPALADTEFLILKVIGAAATVVSIPEVNRLALVVNLVKPEANQDDAMDRIAEAVGFAPKVPKASDLQFQINSRKSLAEPEGLEINRLLRFTVNAFQRVAIQLNALGDISGQQQFPVADRAFAAAVMIDTNTVPRVRAFTDFEFVTIWNALCAESLALRASGGVAGLRT